MGAAFRAREFRRSASLLLGGRRVRNRQFGTTVRRDAPRGNAPARVVRCAWSKMHRERMTMSMVAHLTLRVMRGLDPRIHEAKRRRKPYIVGASSWIAGSSPAMTNVGSAFGETNPRTRFGETNPRSTAVEQCQCLAVDQAKQPSSPGRLEHDAETWEAPRGRKPT